MTTFAGDTDPSAAADRQGPRPPASPDAVLIPPELRQAACARLVADQAPEPLLAARRFIETASELGIDLDLMWGTLDPSRTLVRQVCLAVLGAGRTAMIFVSDHAGRRARPGRAAAPFETDTAERVAVIQAACNAIGAPIPGKSVRGVRLAQALLEPKETAPLIALRRAGFRQLGDLAYMRREPAPLRPARARAALPPALALRSVADLLLAGATTREIDALLIRALEDSYIDTRDCPELCGLREASDVLESHKSVGRYDPALWWLLMENDSPRGCAFYSISPEHDSVELVYLGLAPDARGRGLGAAALDATLGMLGDRLLMSGGVTCAVDTRNVAAIRLYQRAGFRRFGVRVPMIRQLATS